MKLRFCDARNNQPTFWQCNAIRVVHKTSGREIDEVIACNAEEGWLERYVPDRRGNFSPDRTERVDCAIDIVVVDESVFMLGKSRSDIEAGVFFDEDLTPKELDHLQQYREGSESLLRPSHEHLMAAPIFDISAIKPLPATSAELSGGSMFYSDSHPGGIRITGFDRVVVTVGRDGLGRPHDLFWAIGHTSADLIADWGDGPPKIVARLNNAALIDNVDVLVTSREGFRSPARPDRRDDASIAMREKRNRHLQTEKIFPIVRTSGAGIGIKTLNKPSDEREQNISMLSLEMREAIQSRLTHLAKIEHGWVPLTGASIMPLNQLSDEEPPF